MCFLIVVSLAVFVCLEFWLLLLMWFRVNAGLVVVGGLIGRAAD